MKFLRTNPHKFPLFTILLVMLMVILAVACEATVDPSPTAVMSGLVTFETTSSTPISQPEPASTRPTSDAYPPATGYDPYPGATSHPGSSTSNARSPFEPTNTATVDEASGASAGTAIAYLPFVEESEVQLPIATQAPASTATTTRKPTATPTSIPPTPTAISAVDFSEIEAELGAQGKDLAYSKIGFHVTFLERKGMLDEWMQQLDAAGAPFFLKTVDNAEPLYKAQQLRKASGVPHTLVFRATGGVPDYDLPPAEAALKHWTFHRDKFPPELDPSLVWVETVNEVDKNRSEWLAQFALETARLALADGFRWAAFGWAPGEPEPEHWQIPVMLEFLRLAGENPDRLAIAVHEGSLSAENIKLDYPYRIGRFLQLFDIADRYGIPRPTVLITEWGWEYNNIPPISTAIEDIRWAAALYAPFPQVKGAAIWNLGTGCCFGDVSSEVRHLIGPLLAFNLNTYYGIPRPPEKSPTDPNLYR